MPGAESESSGPGLVNYCWRRASGFQGDRKGRPYHRRKDGNALYTYRVGATLAVALAIIHKPWNSGLACLVKMRLICDNGRGELLLALPISRWA
jgi:hypothetical protein